MSIISDKDKASFQQESFEVRRVSPSKINRLTQIRVDSPRTYEAILELGIDSTMLAIKQLNDFEGPNVSADVAKLRYDHYIARSTQLCTEILQKRREIIQRNKVATTNNQNIFRSLQQTDQGVSTEKAKGELEYVYGRTLEYLKSTHKGPHTKDPNGLFSITFMRENYQAKELERSISKDLSRYNKMKKQKEREASILLEEETKKMVIQDEIERKRSKVEGQLALLQREREKKLKKRKQILLRKQLKQEESQQQYGDDTSMSAEKLSRTLHHSSSKKSYSRGTIKGSNRVQTEVTKLQSSPSKKRVRVLSSQQKVGETFDEEQLKQIEDRVQQGRNAHDLLLKNSVEKMRNQLRHEKELIQSQKLKQTEQNEYHFQRMISKLVERQENFQRHMSEVLDKELIKRRQKKMKQKKVERFKLMSEDDYKYIFELKRKKMQSIEQRFKKIDDNQQERQQQFEKRILFRQEQRKLKEQDKQDNYNRQVKQYFESKLRIQDLNTQKSIEKKIISQNRLLIIQMQKEKLQQASIEISRQEIMERERIYSGIDKVSQSLYLQQIEQKNQRSQDTERLRDITKRQLKELFGEDGYPHFKDQNLKSELVQKLNPLKKKPAESDVQSQSWNKLN